MEKRVLGNTGMMTTVLGYGAMALRDLDERQTATILNALLDQGVNLVDTSPDYRMSEALIGKTISHRRDEYILASKCGCNIDASGQNLDPKHIWTRARLLENLENSLRLLKTDHIDIWQMHCPTPEDLPGGRAHETIQSMLEQKRQGKVRAIGVSFPNFSRNHPLYPAEASYQYAGEMLDYGFDMMQVVYGGLTRKCEAVISRAARRGLGIITRGVVRQYFDDYAERFVRAGLPELCAPGESMSQFLIRFAISHPDMDSAIIGTGTVEHLAENIRAAECGPLPAEVYAEAKRRLDGAGIVAEPWAEP